MITKYMNWITQQDLQFILEVHPDKNVPCTFKDGNNNNSNFTLQDLMELDNKYINPEEKYNE